MHIMNEYILLEQITIERPIVFLCGPYYNKKDEADRRKTLKEEINRQYKNKILPLIIDDFLTEENINDKTISIQLMEEICAAVSVKTYIFLDTLSSSAELGIFANSSYMNKIQVFIPKVNDIYNKKNVGYFAREVSLKSKPSMIKVLEYRPSVQRNAIASDYIVEYYGFVDNKIPNNIQRCITDDEDLKVASNKTTIQVIESADMPQSPFHVHYSLTNQELQINTSIRLLFYVTLSILACEYSDLFSRRDSDFSKINLHEIMIQVKNAFFNLIESKSIINKENLKDVKFKTVLKAEQNNDLIRHIVKFLHVFNNKSDYDKIRLFKDPVRKIINPINKGRNIFDVIKLSQTQINLIKQINKEPDLFFERIKIRNGNKLREIVKYRDNENGEKVRKLHAEINDFLKQEYVFCENSYAYKNGENIKTCVENHIDGMGFIKYDVRKFFNSISIEMLVSRIIDEFGIDVRYIEQLKTVLKSCSYSNQIPLGFVTSPILSDIFMKRVDEKICAEVEKYGFAYTRYADDILISSKNAIELDVYNSIDQFVKDIMLQNGLVTNETKNQFINFDNSHSFFNYLGVSIVHRKEGNVISLGKSYINSVAKEYITYDQKRTKHSDLDDLFYSRLKVIGKIGFIKHIEGEPGIERLKRRLYNYDPNVNLENI